MPSTNELHDFLETKYRQYCTTAFIESDPISIPHLFTKKEDREIAGFLTATIAWGQRKTLIKNARQLMLWMDDDPHRFIMQCTSTDLKPFKKFIHRTFNGSDCIIFLKSLQYIYQKDNDLQILFEKAFQQEGTMMPAISSVRNKFFYSKSNMHALKHFADPLSGSAAKRINMFLRWMVRQDKYGVDFGIWKSIPPSALICPLDVHSGRVARKLGLLNRKQDDAKAALVLTEELKLFDPNDPAKYDFALFGLGVFEKF
jgi:uncharacterized protein (TIGR02757 family)